MPLGDFLCPFPLQHKQKVQVAHALVTQGLPEDTKGLQTQSPP